MNELHRFLWRVKGRVPSSVTLGWGTVLFVLLCLDDFIPPLIGKVLSIVMFLPVFYCLVMVYTYFAIAIPLLGVAYLGGLFSDLYPTLAPYAIQSGVVGVVALVLGIAAEIKHAKEKKPEIRTRYEIKLPLWFWLPTLLGLFEVLRRDQSGHHGVALELALTYLCLALLMLASVWLLARRKARLSRELGRAGPPSRRR